MTRFFWLLIGIAVMKTSGATEPEKPWHVVHGAELRKLFTNHELSDGVHYTYRFKNNGTFTGTEIRRDVRGTWKTTADYICWSWIKPIGSEECYLVRRHGNDVIFLKKR